jgi:LPS O-antigen subunit length determinant protein (WzzB/FepE family)
MNINISNVFLVLLEKKLSIICITLIFSFTSVIYALMQENIFQASGLYKESVNADAQPGFNSGLSNVAALAGISTGSSNNKMPEAVEIINSHVFLINFIKKYEYQDEVFAAEKINSDNTIVYNSTIYDVSNNKWVNGNLSDNDLFKRISSDMYTSRDRITGFTRVTYRHLSPYFAKEFLDNLIYELNEQMRQNDLAQYAKAIDYLNIKLRNEVVESQRAIISSLIQNYLQKETIASISDEYVLSSIEPPYVNLQKIGPNRKLLVIAFTVLGFIFSVLFIFFQLLYKNYNTDK